MGWDAIQIETAGTGIPSKSKRLDWGLGLASNLNTKDSGQDPVRVEMTRDGMQSKSE